MQDSITDKIELKILPTESQYNLMRRALITFAKLADLPPSEQILFADTYAPKRLNTPSFELDWAKGDPSRDGISTVKTKEFNNVRGTIIEFSLLPNQKDYLKQKRLELIREGRIRPNILVDKVTLYDFSSNGGYTLWHNRVTNSAKKSNTSDIKNVDVPEELNDALRQLET